MKKPDNKSLHVLFADDNSDEAYLFNEAIEQLGLSVFISKAKDGKDLMNKLLTSTEPLPDVLFLDLNMPYKDGLETLKEIKSNEKFNNLPVVIFSTSANLSHTGACYECGADLYIVKPQTFDQILKMAKKIFAIDWKQHKRVAEREEFVITSFV